MSASGIRIQHDWDKAILAKDKKFWIHIYNPDKTLYHNVKILPESFEPDIENVTCRIVSSKSISLEDKTKGLRSTFQCPDITFSSIHKLQRQPTLHVNSFDLNGSGELALSTASDGNVFLWETETGDIRHQFSGHASEVYCGRFFPSGLVAVTCGSDMQLKIWSTVTGDCAATLQPGIGGSDPDCSPEEPGGHRTGVIDVDFIDRGKNIVSLDRGGWLRLWDVSSQLAISAINVVPCTPPYVNCAVSDEPKCCAVKNRTWETPSETPAETVDTGESPKYCVLETSSNKPVACGVTDKLVAVGTGCQGILSIFDLTSPSSRREGPMLQLSLPGQSGAVTACCFSEECGALTLDEFGVIAGGENGEIACWDIRNHKNPLVSYAGGPSGVVKLRSHHWASHNVENASGDVITVPAFTGLFAAYRDGRTTLQAIAPITKQEGLHQPVLELTGPDVDAVRGLSLLSSLCAETVNVWTGTNSGHFYCYRNLAVDCLFS